MFTKDDINQIQSKEIDVSIIERQIEHFRKGFPFVELHSSAAINNGIKTFTKDEVDDLVDFYSSKLKDNIKIVKFVPASGAASRMFSELAACMSGEIADTEAVNTFFSGIQNFAFYDDLKEVTRRHDVDIESCVAKKEYAAVIEYLLTEKGLNYASLPKALLKFHSYKDYSRTALEEHLVEGADYCKDTNGNVSVHFTVSPEHQDRIEATVGIVKPKYDKMFDITCHIHYSVQKPSTDTVAVDMKNKPFREPDGSLLFRPGGHGALLENLNDIHADIVFIKNIDNVAPDNLKNLSNQYKKAIGGHLLRLQQTIHEYLNALEGADLSDEKISEIIQFLKRSLFVRIPSRVDEFNRADKIKYLFDRMNRPIRVCGMVKNEGEPGGGPFWIKETDGNFSLQIVESSQVDMKQAEQREIFNAATHFNPVDLVCAMRDYRGNIFDLRKFVDASTGFISVKMRGCEQIKVQELPGLWNGAMAKWLTVFVEVPVVTFTPVKTINDLLRKEHQ